MGYLAQLSGEAWNQTFAFPGYTGVTWTPERILVAASGDLASDYGRIETTWRSPTGLNTEVDKYLTVWKKVDGKWKVLYDTYATNAPSKP